MSKKANIFKDVHIFSSASSSLLNPEDCPIEVLEQEFFKVYETGEVSRDFTPWFHYQALEYIEYIIDKRFSKIRRCHCE